MTKLNLPKDEIINLFLVDKLTIRKIALKYNCSSTPIEKILKDYDKNLNLYQNRYQNLPVQEMINEYLICKSINQVANKFHLNPKTVSQRLKDAKIDISIKTGSNNSFYTGCKEISGRWWSKLLQNAKNRNIKIDITIEYIWKLFLKQDRKCIFTNVDLHITSNRNDKLGTASLDRIDSSKGYIEGNVQWVHKKINMMKRDMSDTEFIEWCALIYQNKLGYQ